MTPIVPDLAFDPFPRYKPKDCPHDDKCITLAQLDQIRRGQSVRCRSCGGWIDSHRGVKGRPR